MNNPGGNDGSNTNNPADLMARRRPFRDGRSYGPTLEELRLKTENEALQRKVNELNKKLRDSLPTINFSQALRDFKDLFMDTLGIHGIGTTSVGGTDMITVWVDCEQNKQALAERLKGTRYETITKMEIQELAVKH